MALQHHALELPEIITRIGQFLPLWTGHGLSREFNPTPLLSCALVSKLFRSQLLPTLWYIYDGFRMRSIPAHILAKYSPYFRIITSTGPFKGPFHCRNLIELWTVYGQEWSRDLLVSNPGLKRLVWGGPFHRRIETLEQQQEWELELKALMGLARLDEFRTSGFSLGEGIFVKVLRNNASQLMNLQMMSRVAGVTSIEGLELPFLTELQVAFGEEESPAMVDLVRCCPRLQRLSLTGSKTRRANSTATVSAMMNLLENANNWDNNNLNNDQALAAAAAAASTTSSHGHGYEDVDPEIIRLSKNLKECCPELSSIKITSNLSNMLKSDCFLNGSECAALIQSCGRLESFSADMVSLVHYQSPMDHHAPGDHTPQETELYNLHFQQSSSRMESPLTEALIRHGEVSLKTLSLSFHETEAESHVNRIQEMRSIQRLKGALRGLKELQLSWDATLAVRVNNNESTATAAAPDSAPLVNVDPRVAAVDEFSKQSWGSTEMESLAIHGLYMCDTSSPALSTLSSAPANASIEPPATTTAQEVELSKLGWRPVKTTRTEARDLHWRDQIERRQQALYQQRTSGLETQTRELLVSLGPLRQLKHVCLNHTSYERAAP
ncbi:hypothetical protein EMPS_06800 [Entomortierella parvispora]|uniref:Uncharacterized protein n=1 Tax=Entomortierella parvispora TaxID=205924 RepID=A0A9P3HD50_9FUNG|nr:hypothetical protein EMPS_06800 [Entomortierella parvispora]